MGMLNISDDIESVFENTTASSGRKFLDDGTYDGTITSVSISNGKKPWIETALFVTVSTNDNLTSTAEIEVSPLTDKTGEVSPGKMKFLKWQLEALGYDGKLSELEYNLEEMFGNEVKFEVKTEYQDKINPKTGKNYYNRDTKFLELLNKVGESNMTATDDDDNLPF